VRDRHVQSPGYGEYREILLATVGRAALD
jgi:hypothetical protein